MEITMDFGLADEVPPEGIYTLKCDKAEWKRKDENSFWYVALQWRIIDEDHPEYDGKFVFDNLSTAPNARWRFEPSVKRIFNRDFPKGSLKLDDRDFVGQVVRAVVVHDSYDDRITLKVAQKDGYMPSTSEHVTRHSESDVAAQAGSFRL